MRDDRTSERAATTIDALERRASETPEALAFAVGPDRLTYGALHRDAARLAGALAARGLGPGGRCALVLPTGVDLLALLFAVQMRRAAPAVVNPSLPPAAIARRIAGVRAELAVVSEGARDALSASVVATPIVSPAGLRAAAEGCPLEAPLAPGEDDIAYLQLTSGTTGEPRAAMVPHRALSAYLRSSEADFGYGPGDVFSSFVPLHHDLGLVRFAWTPVFVGCPAHLLPASITSLGPWLETISRVRATVTGAPDFAYRIAARTVDPARVDLRSLRIATNGGEPVRKSTIDSFEARFGVRGVILPGYGLAEATLGVTSARPGEPVRLDARGNVSCGRPIGGVLVRIEEDGGGTAPAGAPGIVVARSPALFAGYLDDEAATREVLRDGWLTTGDVGALDDAGRLTILGRRRALIKRGGAVVAPREVEEAADGVPDVRLSAAVGVERGGGAEDLVLVVEARPEAVLGEAGRASLRARISEAVEAAIGFAPAELRFVPPRAIPRTGSGKVRYDELRGRLLDGTLAGA